MDKPLRIYIAGPYTAETPQRLRINTEKAIDVGIALFRKGHIPYIPHLTHYVDMRAKRIGVRLSWNDFIKWDEPWLDVCDALLYLGKSKGADLEMRRARRLKKIIFRSLDEIPQINGQSLKRAISVPSRIPPSGSDRPGRHHRTRT